MKIIKKIICILLFFIFSISSFAAIVADNDGNTFVTKDEFDGLKISFESQIKNYNDSIDNKIDGAIANYLAGISFVSQVTTNIIFNDWEDVTCMNGVINPEFELPNFTANVSYWLPFDYIAAGKTSSLSYGFNLKFLAGNWKGTKVNSWDKTKTIKRALVTENSESATDQSANMVWDGIAKRYEETYTFTRTYFENAIDPGYGDRLDIYVVSLKLVNISNLLMNGYYPNYLNETKAVVNPTIEWYYGSGSPTTKYSTFSFDNDASKTRTPIYINTSNVTLGEDASGKTKELEHIVQWNKNTEWCVSNPTFLKTFRKNSNNTKKASELLTSCSVSGRMDMLGALVTAGLPTGYNYTTKQFDLTETPAGTTYKEFLCMQEGTQIATSTSDNQIIPSIGMLQNNQAASKIKQHNKILKYSFDNYKFDIGKPTLEQGYQLLAATKFSKIKWLPVFNNKYFWDSSASTPAYKTDNTKPINVMFSLGPFTDKNTPSTLIKVTQNGSAEKDYATIIGASTDEIEFKMPEDGIVYVKWWPAIDDSSLNKDWRVTLDNVASKEYMYILSTI